MEFTIYGSDEAIIHIVRGAYNEPDNKLERDAYFLSSILSWYVNPTLAETAFNEFKKSRADALVDKKVEELMKESDDPIVTVMFSNGQTVVGHMDEVFGFLSEQGKEENDDQGFDLIPHGNPIE